MICFDENHKHIDAEIIGGVFAHNAKDLNVEIKPVKGKRFGEYVWCEDLTPVEYGFSGPILGDRTCVFCHLKQEKFDGFCGIEDGADGCLGILPGVSSACCGHGLEPGYIVFNHDSNGNRLCWVNKDDKPIFGTPTEEEFENGNFQIFPKIDFRTLDILNFQHNKYSWSIINNRNYKNKQK